MPSQRFIVPVAVLLAVIIIGTAGFVAYRKKSAGDEPQQSAALANVRVPDDTDHILGSPNAPIIVIEYSDFECPFCKQYHETLRRIMDEYGKDGKVAWVFRQLPLAQLHSKAPTEALASECVADLGGNTAFWKFVDELFSTTPSNNNLDLTLLPNIASNAGVDRAAFEACMKSGALMTQVEADFKEAVAAGAQGTPFTVIITQGQQARIDGAQMYPAMKAVMDTLLRQIGATGLVPPTAYPMPSIDGTSTPSATAPAATSTPTTPATGTAATSAAPRS